MTIGTKSVLFGVHQFIWHPLTVGLAWRRLFRVWPTWREWVCIFVHDLGYIGRRDIDGEDGREHPRLGAVLAFRLLGASFGTFTLLHSRDVARRRGMKPSPLCWADKFSVWCDPAWFYLLRAGLSGEIREFKSRAPAHVRDQSDAFWLQWYRTGVKQIPEVRDYL